MTRHEKPLFGDDLPLNIWLSVWRAFSRYFRYEVSGLEHLDGPASLIAGYHGRMAAWDSCMLSAALADRLGYMPHGIFHGTFGKVSALRWFVEGIGCVFGDDERLAEVVARGEHIITVPGGTREAYRPFWHNHTVNWGQRTGYLRLAIRHRLPVVPVAASGVDWAYVGLNDGYRLGKRVGMPGHLPLWLGLGPLGPAPLSPPFPVKVRQIVGPPIWATADGSVDINDRGALLRLHADVVSSVQSLLDRARRRGAA